MSTMSVARQPVGSISRRPASGTLAEVVDIILDKGLVLDAYVRVSLIGIELLTVEARVVIASVDTYLHFAEATNRLDLRGQAEERDASLTDLVGSMRGD
jgi:gas vesicle structural protein